MAIPISCVSSLVASSHTGVPSLNLNIASCRTSICLPVVTVESLPVSNSRVNRHLKFLKTILRCLMKLYLVLPSFMVFVEVILMKLYMTLFFKFLYSLSVLEEGGDPGSGLGAFLQPRGEVHIVVVPGGQEQVGGGQVNDSVMIV